MIEIETADYGSLFLFTRRASEDATIISIDLPAGSLAEGIQSGKSLYTKHSNHQTKNYT